MRFTIEISEQDLKDKAVIDEVRIWQDKYIERLSEEFRELASYELREFKKMMMYLENVWKSSVTNRIQAAMLNEVHGVTDEDLRFNEAIIDEDH